ncbi:MAG: iron-containing alcohol dehydrogenase [Bacteroidota bacterium]
MKNFEFHNPTRIYFGTGQIATLSDAVPRAGTTLLLYGGGSIKRNGVYDQVKDALGDRSVIEFGGIEANPTYETLMKAVAVAREADVRFLLSVGGGSVLDGTKFVAAAVPFEGDPWTILSEKKKPATALPLGAVLTLPATGSEMNPNAVISRRDTQEKLAFASPLLYPVFSVLDPETTFSLPPRQVANGIVDTFVHVMEQYLTYPAGAPLQDRFAEGILQTLIEEGPKTLSDPTDYTSRANLFWCSTLALNGLLRCGVPTDWATHVIGHELTALYGIDHARTLAVVLPSLLANQRAGKREKLLQYAHRVWHLTEGADDERIDQAIQRTAAFFESLGVPARLSRYDDVTPDTPQRVARRLKDRGATALGERGAVTPEQVAAILSDSLT